MIPHAKRLPLGFVQVGFAPGGPAQALCGIGEEYRVFQSLPELESDLMLRGWRILM
jgi:hypothetical protein